MIKSPYRQYFFLSCFLSIRSWGNGLENLAGDVGNFANTFAKGFVAGPIEAAKDVMGGNDGGAQAKANALYGQQGVQRQPVVVQQKPVVYQQQPVEY